jgi:prepilin-type N-terminal cleavage/methylation domain-containing protein
MRGYTLIELLIAMSLAALVVVGLTRAVRGGLAAEAERAEREALAAGAQYALERMAAAVRETSLLMLPLPDHRSTPGNEALREQSVPAQAGQAWSTAVLAVALPRDRDRNADGVSDADNDGDGRFDEDHRTDSSDDGRAGIYGIDDDNDGFVDEFVGYAGDDDEDGWLVAEDRANGLDDDGDGRVDEDMPADMNLDAMAGVAGVDDDGDGITDEGHSADDDEDGRVNEDGIEPVVFRLAGSTLMERVPVPWDESGDGVVNAADFVEQPLAEGATYFRVERIAGGRATLVDLTLELQAASGAIVRLATRQRVGSGQ